MMPWEATGGTKISVGACSLSPCPDPAQSSCIPAVLTPFGDTLSELRGGRCGSLWEGGEPVDG